MRKILKVHKNTFVESLIRPAVLSSGVKKSLFIRQHFVLVLRKNVLNIFCSLLNSEQIW
jgi:hypothetical protein